MVPSLFSFASSSTTLSDSVPLRKAKTKAALNMKGPYTTMFGIGGFVDFMCLGALGFQGFGVIALACLGFYAFTAFRAWICLGGLGH